MGFIDDFLNNSLMFRLFNNSICDYKLAKELLEHYNIDHDVAKLISQHSKYKDIYNENVIRFVLVKRDKAIGTVSFTKRDNLTYEIGYYIIKDFRGNSEISKYLDIVYEVFKDNNLFLLAKTNIDNIKSISLIENHLKLNRSFTDLDNKLIIYGGYNGKSC